MAFPELYPALPATSVDILFPGRDFQNKIRSIPSFLKNLTSLLNLHFIRFKEIIKNQVIFIKRKFIFYSVLSLFHSPWPGGL